MSLEKAIARAWKDPAYKAELLKDPRAVLTDAGVIITEGIAVKVVEDTPDTVHLVLTVPPRQAGDLSLDELERAAAESPPWSKTCTSGTCWCTLHATGC